MTELAASTRSQRTLPYAEFEWDAAIPHICHHLPRELVSEIENKRFVDFASSLPCRWHWGMLETRLGNESPPPDLLAAMAQLPETRKQLTELFDRGGHQALDPARKSLLAWAKADGSLFSDSPSFWLEWDRDAVGKPALPWLFLAPDFLSRHQAPLVPEQLEELANQFMDSGEDLQIPGAAACLRRIAERLPQGGKLMYFSSLRPRGKSICRAFVRLPRGGTMPFLTAIDWPGDRNRLPALLPLFSLDGEDEWCQIEFDTKVGPYLGLELAQTERGFAHRPTREQWLETAVNQGWAQRTRAEAVLNWHGQDKCSLPTENNLRALRSFHLKLSLADGAPPLAKAYLGFYFRRRVQSLAA